MTNDTVKYHFDQYIDRTYQYDPAAGARDGFGVFTVPYGSSAHRNIQQWLREHSTGMVCVSWQERRKYRGRTWTTSDVKFEFQKPSEAVYAKLTFGGAA